MLKMKSRLGPALYAAGGFTVTFDEFETVISAIAKCSNDDVLAAGNTQYSVRVTWATNIVTMQVWTCTAGAWAQIANGSVLNALMFVVLADCE